MRELIEQAFRDTVGFLPGEIERMPLGRWSEAVFRYFFSGFLSQAHPEVEQYFECNHIDLVLRRPPDMAFVEFKFYGRPFKFDPYTGQRERGFKGGPSLKNRSEFEHCIDQLANRRTAPNLSKYVVLFYADAPATARQVHSFSKLYDNYEHHDSAIPLLTLENKQLQIGEQAFTCRLYEVSVATAGAGRTSEAAHYLGLGAKAIRRLILTGELPYVQMKPGNSPFLLDRRDLDRFIEIHKFVAGEQ